MKIYLVANKWFGSEEAAIKYITNEKLKGEKIELYQVKIIDATLDSETNASDLLNAVNEQKELDTKINAVFGDEFSQKVQTFKMLFDKFSQDNILDKRFKIKLDSTPIEKKKISRLLTSNVGYLFYFNTSVEWYKAILDIHNFKKIEDFYYREVLYSNGSTRFSNVKVNEDAKVNFNKAKLLK